MIQNNYLYYGYYIIKIIFFILLFIIYLFSTPTIEYFSSEYNKYFDKCFVINLVETKEGIRRLKLMKEHKLIGKNLNVFKGTYGLNRNKKLYDNKIINTQWDYGKWLNNKSSIINMTDGEIGCCISHFELWKYFLSDTNLTKILILEDDAINISDNFYSVLDTIYKNVPEDWDIILLGFWLHRGDNGYKINDNIYKVNDYCLTHSYIINRKGALKLIKSTPISKPLDSWISGLSHKINIYRHNYLIRYGTKKPSSKLIRQNRGVKQIVNTNNYII